MFLELPNNCMVNSDHIIWYDISESNHNRYILTDGETGERTYEYRTHRYLTIKMTDGREFKYEDTYYMIDNFYYHLQNKIGFVELKP